MKQKKEFIDQIEQLLIIALSNVKGLKDQVGFRKEEDEIDNQSIYSESGKIPIKKEAYLTKVDQNELKETYLNFKEMCELLGIAESTGYQRISRGEIPNFKKGRRLYFKRSELMKYIESGRRKTIQDIDEVAEQHLRNFQQRQ